ncbi:MAG: polysaccharide lyase family 8 super-sandwich domain-containing protein, partial [Tepidisphaeraceae bacterium]
MGGVLHAPAALADNGAVDRSREIMLPADAPVRTQLQELEKRWGDFYLKYDDPAEITRLNRAADRLFPLLGADGRFSDLRYANVISKRDGGPGWGDHLLRLVDLFTAWRTPGTKVFGDAAFAKRCAKGLDVYCAQPYDRNDAWGFGHPYADLLESNRIGRICLFARTDPKAIPQAQIERWAGRIIKSIFQPSDDPATQFTRNRPGLEGGANLLWSARGELAAYLVQSDEALRLRAVDRYLKYIWRSMTIASPKGPDGACERLTVDGMLGEHHVPAMGSYGEWYVTDIVNFRDALQGLPRWQMPGEINKVFVDLLLDSVAFCYQGAIDPHLCDHGAWLNGRAPHNATLRRWMTAFLGCGYRTDELKRVLAWEPGVSDWPIKDRSVRQYYTIDYMTKHYPRWMASVRAVSNRTYGMETFAPYHAPMRNDDLNIFVPLGTCFLRRDTREFQDLATGSAFAALDFARLPGLTTKHVDDATIRSCWNSQDGHPSRYVWGNTPFSVGVATDQTGLMGWWQSRYVLVDKDKPQITKRTDISVDGRRATFFLEDAIVQLGAGFDIRD